jgi:hypothetical protein
MPKSNCISTLLFRVLVIYEKYSKSQVFGTFLVKARGKGQPGLDWGIATPKYRGKFGYEMA